MCVCVYIYIYIYIYIYTHTHTQGLHTSNQSLERLHGLYRDTGTLRRLKPPSPGPLCHTER